ncbi:MAG TPA: hypothetical protein VGJ57_01740 [Nitrospirales bacterium]
MVFSIIAVCVVFSGCPHTQLYGGLTSEEKEEFKKSNREVYPDDVRKDLEKFRTVEMAWPGVILDSKVVDKGDHLDILLLLEHHYYDWLLDHSIQREKIFLSPRGEGLFRTSFSAKKQAAESEIFQESITSGNLVIVYGKPEKLEDNIIVLSCGYPSLINRKWFRTDILDYGRPGEPVFRKKVPLPSGDKILERRTPLSLLPPPP